MRRPAPRVSVVVPAHDEESVIARCLTPLARLAAGGEADVVVVANGCSDGTAAAAGSFPGVRVVEVTSASKVAALNAGNQASSVWPRLYLDADVVLLGEAALALAEALDTAEAVAGSVGVRFVVEGRPWLVRAFYRAYEATPYVREGLVGLGLYGLSEAGHQRLGAFPDVVADDLHVQQAFAPHERHVLRGHRFDVQVPRTVSALLAVRTRTAAGNAGLQAHHRRTQKEGATAQRSTRQTSRALVRRALADPRHVVDVGVYAAITLLARARARGRHGRIWQRDATTR